MSTNGQKTFQYWSRILNDSETFRCRRIVVGVVVVSSSSYRRCRLIWLRVKCCWILSLLWNYLVA